jgi:signal transduction histidine kinase/ActR/RegA family two-component response regulator
MRDELKRVQNALAQDQVELDADAVDYAMWDDTYGFVVAPDPQYVESNLNDSFFTTFQLTAALMMRSNGNVVWGHSFNLRTRASTPLPADLARELTGQSFAGLRDPEHRMAGLVFVNEEPLLVAARPIVTSDGKGPARGVFVVVRQLDNAYMRQLGDLTRLDIRLLPLPQMSSGGRLGEVMASLDAQTSPVVRPEGANLLTGYVVVNDIYNRRAGLLEVTTTRLIAVEGRHALWGTLAIFAIVTLLLGLLIHRVLERSVLSPLSALQAEVRALRPGTGGRVRLKPSSPPELLELAETINTSVSELETAEQTLAQSQKVEAIGQLAGGIAHDFNNLLTAIIGQTELLRGSECSPEESEMGLREIRAAADRATALTRQLLAFSRRQALQPRVLNVNDVTQSMTGLLQRLLGEHIDLVFQADPALWPIEADPGQLEQVIMNLAINARDAMPQGGKLTLETQNVELGSEYAATHTAVNPGRYVLLAVTDTGSGMDKELLSHIFEPFFTTKAPGKGTGLGLSTVYGIVKQSGGNIWVYSEPGQGSTFKIYLPRAEKPIDWSPADKASPIQSAREGDATILVVEDEPAVRSLITRVLERQGYEVLGAGSSEEGIALFDRHPAPIDLILSDVILPGMSGRAMVELLLDRPGVAPRILYMSGYTRNAIVHEGRLDEGLAFLEKPFTPDALLRKVREVLSAPLEAESG